MGRCFFVLTLFNFPYSVATFRNSAPGYPKDPPVVPARAMPQVRLADPLVMGAIAASLGDWLRRVLAAGGRFVLRRCLEIKVS